MRLSPATFAAAVLVAALCCPPCVNAGRNEDYKVQTATEVLEELMDIPEEGIPPALLSDAHGVAVIPEVIKAGFVLGARYGQGIMVVRIPEGGWSNPVFVRLGGGSVGWQIGVQSTDVVLVFKNRRSIEAIADGTFTLGLDASVAAGAVGRDAAASTDADFKAEIYSYSRSRGLFAGLSLEGASLQVDHEANEDYYGVEDIEPDDILETPGLVAPESAGDFRRALERYVTGASREERKNRDYRDDWQD